MKIDIQKVYLRKAELSDALITYKWAMDSLVRKNSLNSGEFSFDSHKEWFLKKINSENCHYFILMEHFPLGQIRFDKYQDGWLISFLIDELFRGNNLGKQVVKIGINKLKPATFYAYVKSENKASIKIFNYHNFIEIPSDIVDTIKFKINA